jgi:GDPmannose 4,6-dehydratase
MTERKRALITGITGQDGSWLADLLVSKGYEVFGLVRPGSTPRTENIHHLIDPMMMIRMIHGDLCDSRSLRHALETADPHEIYHLGAQSHVKVSFDMPEYTGEATALGTMRLLEAIRSVGLSKCRFYQASSSELFGKVQEVPQRETTPFYPRSPYACAKAYSYYAVRNYREAYGLFAVNGILFNHESPRRSQHFVTRKVTLSAARIAAGIQRQLRLGNLEAKRDWGWAPEFVEGMWRMLQADEPDDYVLATGESHSVRELCQKAFERVGLDWEKYVVLDDQFKRPAEVDLLLGDASKAERLLGWTAQVKFDQIVQRMVDADKEHVACDLLVRERR